MAPDVVYNLVFSMWPLKQIVAGVNFVSVDKLERVMKSFERGPIKAASEIFASEGNPVRNQKGLMLRTYISNATNHYTCQDLWTDLFMLTVGPLIV